MVLLQYRRLPAARMALLAAATVPMLAVLAGERIAAHAVHGKNVTSLLGRHLFAKAGLIDAPPRPHPSPDPVRARLEEHLDLAYAPIRGVINRAPREIRGVLALYYEACLQGPCVPELRRAIPWSEPLNDVLIQVGGERIARAPLNYAKLTAMHYRSLWTAYKLRDPDTTPVLNAFLASNRPLPFERDAFALSPQDTLEFRPYAPVRYMQPVVTSIGWLTGGFALLGLAAVASRRRLPQAVCVASLASLTAHGGLLFSVLFAAGISRFMISLWPAITTAVLFGAWWTLGGLFHFRKRGEHTGHIAGQLLRELPPQE